VATGRDTTTERKRLAARTLKRWLPLAVLVTLMASIFATGLHRYVSLEAIVKHADALKAGVMRNYPAALLAYFLGYVAVVALSLPGALIMTLVGGHLFGWTIGAPLAILGATAGACVLYFAAQSSLGETLRERAGPRLQALASGIREDAASYMLFLRLAPVFPFALVNLAAATFSVPFGTFLWTTLIGIMPGTAAFCFAGASLEGILETQREAYMACKAAAGANCMMSVNLQALVSKKLLMAFAALGFVAIIPVIARRFFRRPAASAAS
jgi:uncharacterized membrane protein YdjX (TVP38/TMEM64 family)